MKELIIIYLFFGISFSHASSYANNRHRSDFHPLTLKAKSKFKKKMNATFRKLKMDHIEKSNLRLKLNHRLISQFGRGLESALEIIPEQLVSLVSIINECIDDPQVVYESIQHDIILRSMTEIEIKQAIQEIALTKIIKISYWGYMSRSEILPSINLEINQITFYSHWNEGLSTYSHIEKREILSKTILGVIKDLEKDWYVFW